MKIVRYQDEHGQTHEGIEQDSQILTPTGDPAIAAKRLAPVVPTQIIGIGLNYRKHAEETNAKIPAHPVVFFKSLGAVQNPGDPIWLPANLKTGKADYECELAIVLGRDCCNATPDNALDFVRGYTAANDVSARDWQKEWGGGQWSRAKSFDGFCPLGPVLVTPDEIPDPNDLRIRTILNGEVMQDWTTADMIFSVPELLVFLSADTTLPAGTVILTGTPHGVGMARTPPVWLQDGDEVTVELEKVGRLTNPVRQRS